MSVNDDHRIQRFYTVTGGGHTAGDLQDTIASEFVPAPTQTFNYTSGGKHFYVSGRFVYEVDPDYTGGPRSGWLGDGSWRLAERYNFGLGEENGIGVKRTIVDGVTPRDLYFFINGKSIVVYDLAGGVQRQSAVVGVDWSGADRMTVPLFEPSNGLQLGGRYNWTDTDGDGVVDGGTVGSGTDGEVVWDIPNGQFSGFNYTLPYVDDGGNIWYADTSRNIIKVPLEGFTNSTNGKRNPVYNWAHRQIVVAAQDDADDFRPYQVRIAGNGDIYALGYTNTAAGNFVGANGTQWLAIFNSSGVRQYLAPTIDNVFVGLAIDPNDSDPDYYFTGETQYASMFTKDGLLVAHFTNGAGSGAPTGWMDQPYSITAFTHPITGKLYVYGENSFYGIATRWRIDNVDTIQRQQGNFTYVASAALSGHWEFESNLNDAAGGNAGLFSGGSPSYVSGQVGNAIDLDGVNDSVSLPYAANFIGYTIAAWVKPSDTTSVDILSRGAADSDLAVHQLRIGPTGKFEHSTNDGFARLVTGTTTVQPNTWYHVAIVASNGGMMRLYVNGVEEGTPLSIDTLFNGGDRFNLGKNNSTQGLGFFDGLIDDVRIYEKPLTQTQIQAIYNNTALSTVTVTAMDATASEQLTDRGLFTFKRDGTIGNLIVNYTTSGSTATAGSDYSSLAGSVTILNGQSTATVTVIPIDDAVADTNEVVVLNLSSSASYSLGSTSSATINIVDNDVSAVTPNGRWAFEDTIPANGTGHEFGLSDHVGSNNGTNHGTSFFDAPAPNSWDGPATYVTGQIGRAINLDGLDDSATIPYSTDASAYTIAAWIKASPLWYTSSITSLNVIARTDVGGTNGNVSDQIRINSNGKFEHFTNDGSGKTVTGTTTVQANTWYHVAIVANNNGTMRLYVNGVEEGAAQGIGTLWTGGDRFSIGSKTATLLPFRGAIDDLQVYDVPLSAAQISAMYNQIGTVTISAIDPGASEPGADKGVFRIVRANTTGDLVVNYVISGTATNGTDYSSLATSVTIPNGSSAVSITITPIDDSVGETDETVILTMTSGTGYAVGMPDRATVTIVDNEPTVTVSATDANAAEQGPTTGVFTVTRTNAMGNLVVHYTVSGTATNGSDYSLLPGSVTIFGGQLSADVTVTPIGDGVAEGDETVILTIDLSPDYYSGAPNNAQVTIADKQPVAVTATDATAAEQGLNKGTFTIARDNANGNLVISYTIGGTATAGTDYSALLGSVTILDGQSSAMVTVTPIEDIAVDPNETVILTISASPNYTVTAPGNATVTIVDNDLSANPTGYWTFNSTLADSAGSNNGTFSGGSPTYMAGKVGNALQMDGQNDFVNFFYPTNLTAYTISAWVKPTDVTSVNIVVRTDNQGPLISPSHQIRINSSGKFEHSLYDSSVNSLKAVTGTTTAVTNTWYHVAIVASNGGMMRLYVNGVEEGTAQSVGTMWFYGDRFHIGDEAHAGMGFFGGLIDDLRIYQQALSPADILAIRGEVPTSVTVSAADPTAIEQGANSGTFTITRDNSVGPLTVFYTLGGSATNNVDYSSLSGSIVIPDGSSAVNITVAPIDDGVPEGNENVILTLSSDQNYSVSAPVNATITISDSGTDTGLGFATNPGWSGSNRTALGNNFGWNAASNQAGGSIGEAGGTFARATSDAYFADTFLAQSYSLNNTITGSGKFDLLNVTSGWAGSGSSGLFIGHFSISAANREFVGLELKNDSGGLTTQMQARARVQLPGGAGTAFSNWINVSTNGNHAFSYTYDPSLGTNGRLTLYIDAQSPLVVDLGAADRSSGSVFNAFGMGYTSNLNSENAPSKTAQLFIDDLQYSGYQPAVSVVASDASAAEQGINTGAFTVTRTNTSGDLVVNYLLTGKATSGSDYSALPGSVTILNGQSSAAVTVTPINDSLAEGDELVLLSLTNGSGYHLSTPYKATVTIADNDMFALDNFENGNGSGGLGWNGAWAFGGTATITSAGAPNAGAFHLQLTGNGATATRAVSLAGAANARVVLDWKANSFEAGETAVVEVFDGTNWLSLLTVADGQDDNVYHHADVPVPAGALNANFLVRIRSLMSSADDLFYIDDIQIVR